MGFIDEKLVSFGGKLGVTLEHDDVSRISGGVAQFIFGKGRLELVNGEHPFVGGYDGSAVELERSGVDGDNFRRKRN